MVFNNNNFKLADIRISYLAFHGFGNDTSAMNAKEGRWKKGRLVVNYCRKYVFLDYAAVVAIGRGTCEIPRVSGQLFGKSRLICVKGSNTFLTWLKV